MTAACSCFPMARRAPAQGEIELNLSGQSELFIRCFTSMKAGSVSAMERKGGKVASAIASKSGSSALAGNSDDEARALCGGRRWPIRSAKSSRSLSRPTRSSRIEMIRAIKSGSGLSRISARIAPPSMIRDRVALRRIPFAASARFLWSRASRIASSRSSSSIGRRSTDIRQAYRHQRTR